MSPVSAVGVISVHLKTLIERNYQVVEKGQYASPKSA